MTFMKAQKYQSYLRMALVGPAGSGKTWTSLSIGTAIATSGGGRVALIDTEHGSSAKYASLWDFDLQSLTHFSPDNYIKAIKEAHGYQVLIVDSLSHAWSGPGGVLEMAGGNFNNWKVAGPAHDKLIETLLSFSGHLIATMRSKVEYLVTEEEVNGRRKMKVEKAGTKPVQRDNIDHEFDIVGDMDLNNDMVISKTRCPELKGKMFHNPDGELAGLILTWLKGEPMPTDPKRQELLTRLETISNQAKEAGIKVKELDPKWLKTATDEEIIARGREIAGLLKAKKE